MNMGFLDDLTDAERNELHEKLSYDLATDTRVWSEPELALWDLLVELVPNQRRTPKDGFIKAYGYRRYQACGNILEELLTRALPPGTRKSTRSAIRAIMGKSLVRYLNARNAPVTFTTLLNNFDKLEYAIGNDYPGYIDARILHLLATMFA